MKLGLRQIALITEKLAPAEASLIEVLGLDVAYRDPEAEPYGIDNVVLPIGNQMLEVIAPITDESTAKRYLDRRGEGGYMVITQCDDHSPRRSRVESLGVRIVHEYERNNFRHMQMHPKDTGGSFFEIDEQTNDTGCTMDGPWMPAGENWQAAKNLTRVSGIAAAEIQCDNPEAVANRWAEIVELPVQDDLSIQLDNATLRFVPCADGKPEGLGGIDIIATDPDAILQAAESINARRSDSQIYLCGMRINIV